MNGQPLEPYGPAQGTTPYWPWRATSPLANALADSRTATTVHTETRQELVYLSRGRLEFLRSATASGLKPVLVSDGLSSLTDPMLRALVRCGGGWAVRGSGGVLRNGLTGRRIARVEQAIDWSPVTQLDDLAIGHLRPVGTECAQLLAHVSVNYPVKASAAGQATHYLATWACGQAPESVGPVEPADRTWMAASLNHHLARGRRLRLVATGPAGSHCALSVALDRDGRTVKERLSGLVGVGRMNDAATFSRLGIVPQVLDGLALGGTIAFALLGVRAGRSDLTQPPMLPHLTTPLVLVLGPGQVRALGIDVAAAVRRHPTVRSLGGGLAARFDVAGSDDLTLPQLGRELGLARASQDTGFSPGHAAALRAWCRL